MGQLQDYHLQYVAESGSGQSAELFKEHSCFARGINLDFANDIGRNFDQDANG